jgi:hypothetical protein
VAKMRQNKVRKVRKVRNVPVRPVRTGYERYESPLGLVPFVPYPGLDLEPAKTDTAFGRRMVEGLGEEGFRVAKSLQVHFGAKVVHYQDAQGEVGKRPGWAE